MASKRAADRPNDRVDACPRPNRPTGFYRRKTQKIERARDPENRGIGEERERLVGRAENDPVLLNGQPGNENRKVKIEPGEAGEPERDPEELQLIHAGIMRAREAKSRAFAGSDCRRRA